MQEERTSVTESGQLCMLVRDRGWTAQQYEDWLGDTLVEALVRKDPPRGG